MAPCVARTFLICLAADAAAQTVVLSVQRYEKSAERKKTLYRSLYLLYYILKLAILLPGLITKLQTSAI